MKGSLPLRVSGRVVLADPDGRILLLRRAAQSRHFAGQWEFPGGKGEPHESLEAALLREVHEETGLTVALGRVLGADETQLEDLRIAYLYLEAHGAGAVRLSAEHDAFAWVPAARLATYDLAPPFRAMAASVARHVA